MTETRQPRRQQPEGSPTEEEVAAAIALILAGQAPLPAGTTPAVAVAALLKLLPGLPDLGEAGDISGPVGRLVVRAVPRPRGRAEAEIRASRANLSYRAHYAIEAFKRVAKKVLDGEGVRAALEGERPHFRSHLQASADRVAGARLNDVAAERWGPVLGWVHTRRTHTHRSSHVAANGANYRVDTPPAETEFMLPGMASHCDCVPGPPNENARMLV